MKTIYKYVLEVTDEQFVKMPQGAKILTIQPQNGQLCMWAEVDTDAPIGERVIWCYGTGHSIPGWLDAYIGTFHNGLFVWHFYDAGYAP